MPRPVVLAVALFVLIGAEPDTGWLPEVIRRDRWGFVVTDTELLEDGRPPAGWPLDRPPMPFETSLPGVFAVGEGSAAIRTIHQHLGR